MPDQPIEFFNRHSGRIETEHVYGEPFLHWVYGTPLGKLALNLLEPHAPDSFVKWGFFNAIFEEKEYAENYVLEALAREMLAADPDLRREFEDALENDPDLAASPSERLRFFYKRSPYWDPQMSLYPVGRITSVLDLPLV